MYYSLQFLFQCAGDFEKVEFLHMVSVPFTDQAITYTTGLDGYPAFQFSLESHVQKPALEFIERVGSSFAITAVVRPDKDEGGYLFAITNPTDTVVQFGLEIARNNISGGSKIVLHYLGSRRRVSSSSSIAEFTGMLMTGRWTKFGLKVKNGNVSLFQDCTRDTSVSLLDPLEGLTFEENSKAYMAQAGSRIGRKFVVSLFFYVFQLINCKWVLRNNVDV